MADYWKKTYNGITNLADQIMSAIVPEDSLQKAISKSTTGLMGPRAEDDSQIPDLLNSDSKKVKSFEETQKTVQGYYDNVGTESLYGKEEWWNDIRGGEVFDEDIEFRNKVEEVADNLEIKPEHLATVMSFETQHTFSPSSFNKDSSATGLLHFMDDTAINLGTTTDELKNMSRVEQMDYVERYLSGQGKGIRNQVGKMNSLLDVYLAVLSPARVGIEDNPLVFMRGYNTYKANIGLDLNKDNYILKNEVEWRLKKNTLKSYEDMANPYKTIPSPRGGYKSLYDY